MLGSAGHELCTAVSGVGHLPGFLVIYLGLRYEQDAVAWCGVALFVLVTGTLAVSSIRYSWLLVRDLSDWRRSGKRVYKV